MSLSRNNQKQGSVAKVVVVVVVIKNGVAEVGSQEESSVVDQ
jgi:hypothetical protein